MKIGIFPGTFDPVHEGHTAFAKTAIAAKHLDRVIMVAEKEPYRKKPFAAWDHRQAMIERATEQIEQVDHDYNFAATLAHQHTMKNMLQCARTHYGAEHEYWFLVGSDVFEHMHRWQEVLRAEEYGGFVVALRDDHTLEWLQQRYLRLPEPGSQLVTIENQHPHTSSSAIRQAAREGAALQQVPSNVAEYIVQHQLYQ